MQNNMNLVYEAAVLYYEKNLTQAEIAKILNVSRPTVSNLLKRGRENGTVNITIQRNDNQDYKKQEIIKEKYNLETVLITNRSNNVLEEIGELGAQYIESRLNDINTLGIGWGTTMSSIVQSIHNLYFPDLSIVPMMGGVSTTDIRYHSNHLAFTLAQKLNAKSYSFYAQAIADTVELKMNFEKSKIVQDSLKNAQNVDLAILGVGNPKVSNTYKSLKHVNKIKGHEIIKTNVAGDILASLYDEEGNHISTSLSKRMIGPTLSDISKMKEVVVVSSGYEKANSIKILLKKNIINHLIIDKSISELLINQ